MTTEMLTQDARYKKALELAARADEWRAAPDQTDDVAYLIPSSEDGYYHVNRSFCSCPDTAYRGVVCKHRLALIIAHVGTLATEANLQTLAANQQARR